MSGLALQPAQAGKRRSALIICCGAHIVQDGLGAALYVLMPLLAQAFGLSYAQVGLIRSAKALATTVLELPAGVLAEHFGERRLLMFGLLSAATGCAVLSLAAGVWMIIAGFVIMGAGSAFQHSLSLSIISNSYDAVSQKPALGLYNSAGDAGKLAFTGAFGLATGAGMAWQGITGAFGLITIAFAGVLLWVFSSYGIGGPRVADHGQTAQAGHGRWGIKDNGGFVALCLAIIADTAVQAGFLAFVAFVMAAKGVPVHLAALALAALLAGGMLGKAGCGFLARRMGVRSAFALVQCATAAGLIAVMVLPPVAAFLALPVLGMVLQGSTSITYGAIADIIRSDRRSRGFAMVYSVTSVAAIIGPAAFGLVSDHWGLDQAMVVMAGISLLAIIPGMLLRHGYGA